MAKPDNNFPRFYAAERVLKEAGWEVVNPARLDEEQPIDGDPNLPSTRRKYASRDLGAILSLRAEDGDAIVTLPQWDTLSNGAPAEVHTGVWTLLKILTVEEAVECGSR